VLTVACVLKSGGIYDATWVERLRAGVARHLPLPHRFVCLSDVDVPCERIPLQHDWPGWWSKVELFKLEGPVLYFDLDTAIVGNIRGIAAAAADSAFVVLLDFYRPPCVGSGVMGWGSDARWLYERFAGAPARHMALHGGAGDQAFIEASFPVGWTWRRWQLMCPDQIVSYKVHCRNGIPANARVVCLHGQPKFKDMPVNDPVRMAWEMAA